MSRKKKIWYSILLVISITVIAFKNFFISVYFIGVSYVTAPDLKYVRDEIWSYNEGFKISDGDFVDFMEETERPLFVLKNDTVYFKGKPRAIVVRTNKYFGELTVKSIVGNEEGIYVNNPELGRL